ncbi:hypothetical protein GCM10009557_34330 [Virgisporangium ochraceum]|uniref:Uncharacterized protein n=1 Tax=Virgisporangium ochraceum TaxID=65505 RepID=A0A8J4EI74_9ACTN|nr:hypothetical protein [Virgisporangium ochraceum]GIJ75431.1 hypothetical protein Voc01_103480 [Virgisporangium ochraceum]
MQPDPDRVPSLSYAAATQLPPAQTQHLPQPLRDTVERLQHARSAAGRGADLAAVNQLQNNVHTVVQQALAAIGAPAAVVNGHKAAIAAQKTAVTQRLQDVKATRDAIGDMKGGDAAEPVYDEYIDMAETLDILLTNLDRTAEQL